MNDNVAYHRGRNTSVIEGSPEMPVAMTQPNAPEGAGN